MYTLAAPTRCQDYVKCLGLVLVNTCAIRDNAEQRVWQRLRDLRAQRAPVVGLLGCMAERLKEQLLEGPRPLVDAHASNRPIPGDLGHQLSVRGVSGTLGPLVVKHCLGRPGRHSARVTALLSFVLLLRLRFHHALLVENLARPSSQKTSKPVRCVSIILPQGVGCL